MSKAAAKFYHEIRKIEQLEEAMRDNPRSATIKALHNIAVQDLKEKLTSSTTKE